MPKALGRNYRSAALPQPKQTLSPGGIEMWERSMSPPLVDKNPANQSTTPPEGPKE